MARRGTVAARAALLGGALLLLPGWMGPGLLVAQEPDTLRPPPLPTDPGVMTLPDTLAPRLPGDTVTRDTVAGDTALPPPLLPDMPRVGPAGPAAGVWEWDREALERLPDLSLLQLLERIPGVVPVRSDIVLQAEGAAVFGSTMGAIRWVLDGFELDPLADPSLDPSRLPLLALQRVRVERRVTGATVHLETLSPDGPAPRSIIEAATGDLSTELFRGMFLAPRIVGGPLALGFERLTSNGATPGSANHTAGWLKWSWVRESTGLQLEYRQSGLDRRNRDDALSALRRDWVVRARSARGPLIGEVYAGASRVEDDRGRILVREGVPRLGARLAAALDGPVPVDVRGAVRLRDHPRLPTADIELNLAAAPLSWLAVDIGTELQRWDDGPSTGRSTVGARSGPVFGITGFAEATTGAPLRADGPTLRVPRPDSVGLRFERSGVRAGGRFEGGGLSLTGAWLRTALDTVVPLGLDSEGFFPGVTGGEVTGFEVLARIPTGWDPLRVEGWYVGMDAPTDWLYLPRHHWRAGLVYHHLPLPSGNVEFFARVEHVFRGRMTVPNAPALAEAGVPGEPGEDAPTEPEAPAALITQVGAYRTTNLELSIRVLTVRAFLRWENMTNRRGQRDLPQFTHPGQHILYGVKWEFVN